MRSTSSMTGKIPELDGVRAVAVLAVIAMHFAYLKWVSGGYLGVDLFFVLSGFLITSLLVAEERVGPVSMRNFYARRAFRILPPLVAAVVLALALGLTTVPAAAAALFFVANMVTFPLGALMATWSLAVEEHFYLLWPILFVALGRDRLRTLGWAILLVLSLRVVLLSLKLAVYGQTYTRLDSLLVGCCAALLFAASPPKLGRWVAPVSLATIVLCFALVPWMDFFMQSFGFTLFAIVCAGFILSLLCTETFVNKLLRCAPAQYVGRRSYGLYLYHLPVFLAFEPLRIEGDVALLAWLTAARVVATIAVAEISYRTIEAWARARGAAFRRPSAPREIARPPVSPSGRAQVRLDPGTAARE